MSKILVTIVILQLQSETNSIRFGSLASQQSSARFYGAPRNTSKNGTKKSQALDS